jgi:hypothetical protein
MMMMHDVFVILNVKNFAHVYFLIIESFSAKQTQKQHMMYIYIYIYFSKGSTNLDG